MPPSRKLGPLALARWGVALTTLVTVGALVASAAANRRAVEEATTTLHRGQGELLVAAIRHRLRETPAPPSSEALESILREQAVNGLRYLSLEGPDGHLIAEAGTELGPGVEPPRGPGPPSPVDLGERIRFRIVPPRPPRPLGAGARPPQAFRPREGRPPRPWRDGGPPPRDPGGPGLDAFGRPEPTLTIELEPLIVGRLARRASRSLLAASVAGGALLAAAAVFWVLLVRREAAARRLEHERRLQALGEMSAVMAHELRNPLASLKGNAQLLAERLPADGRERRKADLIVREAGRLETLCQALLDFSRSGPIELRPTDPAALVREVAAAVELEAGPPIEVEAGAAPASWRLDPLRLQAALANVVRNARQAAPETAVEVAVAVADGRLEIAVRDHGPGLPVGEEASIFEPFVTRRARGTGLGLTVARRVAEMHGGTLTASNAPGGGAELLFSLPTPSGA